MARELRWSLCGLALLALMIASPVTLHGQLGNWIIDITFPRQLVEILDDRGRVRVWRLEANTRIYDTGRAIGDAVLERGGVRYEFGSRTASYVMDGDTVQQLTLVGVGVKSRGNSDEDFTFTATVTPQAAKPGDVTVPVVFHVVSVGHPGIEVIDFEGIATISMR